MTKLVKLNFVGSFENGFTVSVEISDQNTARSLAGISGRLPSEPEIPKLYSDWQSAYGKLDLVYRLSAFANQVTNVSSLEDGKNCDKYAKTLSDRLREWLESPSFGAARRRLSREISPEDDVRILLQSSDPTLYRLPWHLCDLFDNAKPEFAWSADSYRSNKHINSSDKNRILVILGSKEGINIDADRQMLERLPNTDIKFLVQPRREELSEELWKQQWDILFFAGHSVSQADEGCIYINETESLAINQLRFGLRNAVKNGLKLAIFNSCDGLGLARSLAELHIPQVIVMREPIPDAVAQIFLKYFLEYFSKGTSLYASVRQARERLESVEGDFPCASWLPIICQNPAAVPFVWINGGLIGWIKNLIKKVINLLRLSSFTKFKQSTVYLIIAVVAAFLIIILSKPTIPIDDIKERISIGEKILITENLTPEKQAGVEAFARGNWNEAIAKFQTSIQQKQNDPETLIYLNNAKIGNTKALKIAVSVPIGSNPNIAQEILRGAAQAQDEVNNSGGINGIPVKLVIADDRNRPEIAAQVATEFTNDNTIIAVMGHNFSEAANAASAIYQKAGLVAVFPTSGNVEVDHKYIFRASSSTHSEAKALAKYAKTKNLTKIAICADSSDRSSRAIKNEFTDSFQKNGGQIVSTTCDFAVKDFNRQLIMQQLIAEGANGILLRPNINKIKDATSIAQANQGKLQLMASSTMYTKDTLDVGKDANGIVVSAIWHPDFNPRNPFAKNAEKLWNGPVSWRTATSYDSMQVIIAGLKQNPNFTKDGLQQFISQKDFSVEGATGTVKFKTSGERDDEGQIILLRVQPNNSLTGTGYGFTLIPTIDESK